LEQSGTHRFEALPALGQHQAQAAPLPFRPKIAQVGLDAGRPLLDRFQSDGLHQFLRNFVQIVVLFA
jgi:hypothetical protein